MIYEIINPSDAYTFESEDFRVAVMAMLLVGKGMLGARPIGEGSEDAKEMPVLLFGADKWCEENMLPYDEMEGFMDEHQGEIADALDSVVTGNLTDRKLFMLETKDMTPEEREAFRVDWHDKHRGSMNDIGTYCWSVAKALKEAMKNDK